MSVTSALYTGVSGLLANGEAMNVIGNNISNVNTVGFKEGRTIFSDLLSKKSGSSQVGSGTQVQTVQNIFTQGTSQGTENVTDLSLQGDSFFALSNPTITAQMTQQNNALLTRAGGFTVDKSLYLVNPDGYHVLDTDGQPIQFLNSGADSTTDFGKITGISTTGQITYLATDGVTQCYYDKTAAAGVKVTGGVPGTNSIATVKVANTQGLIKQGGSLYKAGVDSGVATGVFSVAANKANGTSEQMFSNTLEQSNVDMATEFVKMITTQRAYSANSKTITTTDQMTQEVLGLIR